MWESGSEDFTWGLPDHNDPPCTIFVNVGVWGHAEAFREQVEPYFNDDKEPTPFERVLPVRLVWIMFPPLVEVDPIGWTGIANQ